jgi:hypothetical protein
VNGRDWGLSTNLHTYEIRNILVACAPARHDRNLTTIHRTKTMIELFIATFVIFILLAAFGGDPW